MKAASPVNSQVSDQLEDLGSGVAERFAELGQSGGDTSTKLGQLVLVDRLHGALELAGVCLERVELALEVATLVSADIFDVVGRVGFEEQQRVGSVRR